MDTQVSNERLVACKPAAVSPAQQSQEVVSWGVQAELTRLLRSSNYGELYSLAAYSTPEEVLGMPVFAGSAARSQTARSDVVAAVARLGPLG